MRTADKLFDNKFSEQFCRLNPKNNKKTEIYIFCVILFIISKPSLCKMFNDETFNNFIYVENYKKNIIFLIFTIEIPLKGFFRTAFSS